MKLFAAYPQQEPGLYDSSKWAGNSEVLETAEMVPFNTSII